MLGTTILIGFMKCRFVKASALVLDDFTSNDIGMAASNYTEVHLIESLLPSLSFAYDV